MDSKSILFSTEIMIGFGMVIAGALALAAGFHDVFTMALIPFGAGLALSDIATRIARATRERVKVRVRRDGK